MEAAVKGNKKRERDEAGKRGSRESESADDPRDASSYYTALRASHLEHGPPGHRDLPCETSKDHLTGNGCVGEVRIDDSSSIAVDELSGEPGDTRKSADNGDGVCYTQGDCIGSPRDLET